MAWDTYKGNYIFGWAPDWASPVSREVYRPYDVFSDLGVARVESDTDETRFGLTMSFAEWSRSDLADINDFFDHHRGRWKGFWLPSWISDIVVTSAFNAAATQLEIEDIKYSGYWEAGEVTGRHILLRWPDDTFICRAIESAPDSTHINLNSATGKICGTGELPRLLVSFLHFARFGQDEIEWQFRSKSVAELRVWFKTLLTHTTTTTSTSTSTTTS